MTRQNRAVRLKPRHVIPIERDCDPKDEFVIIIPEGCASLELKRYPAGSPAPLRCGSSETLFVSEWTGDTYLVRCTEFTS